MNTLLHKLSYKNQNRIAILNAEKGFIKKIQTGISDVLVDKEIDPRYPYEFMLIFVRFLREVEELAPKAVHNLVSDGTLWFAFPKKSTSKITSDLDREHGWEILLQRGFDKVKHVSIDKNWSAIRFRNVRYIKPAKYK
ncbi:MAG: hypothetical protein ACUVTX_12280 [Bacteroidales bacterium]